MKNWFTITNKADADTEILLYGEIGRGWDGTGNDPTEFVKELAKIPKSQDITLRIHSPGGSVFDGLAIYNRLAERREHLRSIVDGVALSAASWIAMAGKTVEMPKTARMMVHDAQGFVIGDSDDMREMAALLDKESDNIAAIYSAKTGKPANEMRELMRSTTWMDGDQAKALGFADTVTESPAIENTFDLSRFRAPGQKGGSPASAVNHITPMENNTTPAPVGPTPQPDNKTEIENLKKEYDAKLETQRAELLTLKLSNIAATRPSINVEEWKPQVIANPGLLKTLSGLPESGTAPVATGVQNLGNPTIRMWDSLKPGADRRAWMLNESNWNGLQKAQAEFAPANVNTLTLTMPRVLEDSWITIVSAKLAMLNAFSRAFSADAGAPLRTVVVPYATAGSAVMTDSLTFETGNATVAEVAITMHHYTVPYHFDNVALNQGWKLAGLADINANVMANQISDLVTAVILVGSYGAGTVIGTAANFDATDLPAILALAANYPVKNLVLSSAHYAYLAPLDRENFAYGERGAYGFDLLVENNRWTGATANTCGFVCSPNAIAVASGLPYPLPTQYYTSQGTATTSNGLTVATCSWFSTLTRHVWASYDICFGAAAGDTTNAEVLLTA